MNSVYSDGRVPVIVEWTSSLVRPLSILAKLASMLLRKSDGERLSNAPANDKDLFPSERNVIKVPFKIQTNHLANTYSLIRLFAKCTQLLKIFLTYMSIDYPCAAPWCMCLHHEWTHDISPLSNMRIQNEEFHWRALLESLLEILPCSECVWTASRWRHWRWAQPLLLRLTLPWCPFVKILFERSEYGKHEILS